MESSMGGNIIQPYRAKSQIFAFNEKPGQLSVLDLKMNKQLDSISIHNEEVTCVAMNKSENTLITGFRDGMVKIFNIEKDFDLIE